MELKMADCTAGCCKPVRSESGASCVLVDSYNAAKIPGWVLGTAETPSGIVPRVSTALQLEDIVGSWKARWGMGRMHYVISPGLYAVGTPDADSPVLVSANYKMSFDRLRRELSGVNAWILVIDTKGINVWCAAGKGTFGTEEIVGRVTRFRLSEVVKHRVLILPQLGAPGVAAHEVHRRCGFRVVYGPVRAADLPAFLRSGNKATPEMREVRFGFLDRLVLTPMELVGVIKPALIFIAVLFLVNLAGDLQAPFLRLVKHALMGFVPFLGAIMAGTVVAPALLPYIPGRAFAWKGWLLGLLWTVLFVWYSSGSIDWKLGLFYLLVLPPVSAYLAMNFTGASTYTSLSGVVREMRTALAAIIVSAGLGLIFLGGKALGAALGMI